MEVAGTVGNVVFVVAKEILDGIAAIRSRKGDLEEVETKFKSVVSNLEDIAPKFLVVGNSNNSNNNNNNNNTNDTDIQDERFLFIQTALEKLQKEVQTVQNMSHAQYMVRFKGCQKNIKERVDSLQFYLVSLNTKIGLEIHEKIDKVLLLHSSSTATSTSAAASTTTASATLSTTNLPTTTTTTTCSKNQTIAELQRQMAVKDQELSQLRLESMRLSDSTLRQDSETTIPMAVAIPIHTEQKSMPSSSTSAIVPTITTTTTTTTTMTTQTRRQNKQQVGYHLKGQTVGDRFGSSVAISSNGRRIAIGGPFYKNGSYDKAGHVKTFEYSETIKNNKKTTTTKEETIGSGTGNWIQIGQDLIGQRKSEGYGYAVAMSSNGNRIAIGGPGPDDDGQYGKSYGHVQVYDWSDDTKGWIPIGQDIISTTVDDKFGMAIAISSNGNRIVIGAPWYDDTNNNNHGKKSKQRQMVGRVSIYDLSSESTTTTTTTKYTWIQIGQDIVGQVCEEGFGSAVAISSLSLSSSTKKDGYRIAIGGPGHKGGMTETKGTVRIYEWSETTETGGGDGSWIQVGQDLIGQTEGEKFGQAIALSSYGNRIAIGGPYHDTRSGGAATEEEEEEEEEEEDWKGRVQIFDWCSRNGTTDNSSTSDDDTGGSWIQVGQDLIGTTRVEAFGHTVALSSDGNRVIVGGPYHTNDPEEEFVGHVQIFDCCLSSSSSPPSSSSSELRGRKSSSCYSWKQVDHSDLIGQECDEGFGYVVGLSSENGGRKVIIGVPGTEKHTEGYCLIYDFENNNHHNSS